MATPDTLNEFEAAVQYSFSPELLRWFTQNPVVDSNLLNCNIIDDIYYFNRNDLDKLDQKLQQKWPLPPKGSRPTIPSGIAREIKQEARFKCPACGSDIGELAHIIAVNTSFCNHPANLIYLCPTHHSLYDYGHKYKSISLEDVQALKKASLIVQRIVWQTQGKLITTLVGVMNAGRKLVDILNANGNLITKDQLNLIFQDVIISSPQQIVVPTAFRVIESVVDFNSQISEVLATTTAELCPLCNGKGRTSRYENCPVCLGNGVAPEGGVFDLDDFTEIPCPLCKGKRSYSGDDCPECGAEGTIPKYKLSDFDEFMYSPHPCPLCNGRGSYEGDDCPECGGNKQVTGYQLARFDASAYDKHQCPLCKGRGSYEGDDCPECGANKQVTGYQLARYDASAYEKHQCPLCKGRGSYEGDDCPECGGNKQVTGYQFAHYDASAYDKLPCPLCNSRGLFKGDDCPMCDGSKKVTRFQRDRFDQLSPPPQYITWMPEPTRFRR